MQTNDVYDVITLLLTIAYKPLPHAYDLEQNVVWTHLIERKYSVLAKQEDEIV